MLLLKYKKKTESKTWEGKKCLQRNTGNDLKYKMTVKTEDWELKIMYTMFWKIFNETLLRFDF